MSMSEENIADETTDLNTDPAYEMTLVDHLQELRKRLIRIIIALAVTSVAGYYFAEQIMGFLIAPVGKLYYMGPAEAFFTYFKLAIVAGFFIALPVVANEMWGFIIPAMTKHEKLMAAILVPSSVVLFYSGVMFSYFVVMPMAIKFFMGFATEALQPMISLGQYISFVLAMLIPFGVVFQLPLILIVLAQFGIVSSLVLIRYQKYVIVAAFVIGGVVSPTPDIFGQTLLALPIIVLYEVSIIIVKYVLRK